MVKEYDYIVIGGGSGGIASANRAAMHGAKVILFEGKAVGGTCVNVGCVPKKVMWYGAQVAETINHYAAEYGFDVEQKAFNFETLKANRQAYIERIHGSYERGFDSNGVERVYEYATFIDAHTVEVAGERYTAPHILIATGGHALYPEIRGAEYGITSDGFFELDQLPKRTAVVGGGYIAVEVAGVLNALGSETHLFVRQDRPLRNFDKEIITTLVDEMQVNGPQLHTYSVPKEVLKNEDGSLTLVLENGQRHIVDTLIWAIGRRPNITGYGLENTGVELNERGFIATDDFENTNVEGLYAIGDVNGKIELTPVAVKTGRQLSERLFNNKPNAKMDYKDVATVIFSHPAIGSIGYSEEAAIAEFGEDQIKVYRSSFTPMYTALGNHRQPSKMKLVTLGKEEKVIGLHGIGYGVDEMIQGFAVAIKMGATKEDFDNTVAIHPTGAEEFVTMR
ncbi:glutathione-disulfide reductase [Streptococcus loxodontisalivarius]|uniref:Glutathione reductase (NADPH) n=1 Tax=Streptococcus loxodontisalivarius TaxID=1349415 RepID=A0ABS2PQW5_9STRE|nr:glutathione-disulfide reductase [Streptococcus loxodontisalivarius]MBM7642433.1 glutathione reductase (NADPH) [Streptococcus loxodontisalivarius]